MDDTTTTTGGPGGGSGGSGSGGSGSGTGPSAASVALASRMHLSLADLLTGSLDDQLIAIEALTSGIATADPVTESDRYGSRFLGQAALRAHLITEALTGAQLDWMGLEAEAGTWDTTKGFRTYPHYVAKIYGMSGASARRMSTLATGLRNGLPATRKWLRSGQIGVDQAQILLKATSTQAAVDSLQLPATPTDTGAGAAGDGAVTTTGTDCAEGTDPTATPDAAGAGAPAAGTDRVQTVEEFLLDNAATRSPEDLRRLVDHFVAIADPDAMDKAHRAAADREYVNLDRTMGGYHLAGFITLEHGQYVRTALEAIMGKPAAGETRTSSQRRAQALGDLAHMALDQGNVGKSASVRPHVGVLMNFPEFLDIVNTTEAAEAAAAAKAGPAAPPRPIAEPLPGLDTTTDPAGRSPRGSGATPTGPTTTGTPATPSPATTETEVEADSAEAPSPSSPAAPADRTSESGTSTDAPSPSSPATPADRTSEPGTSTDAPTPSSESEETGLPTCQSGTIGPLGQTLDNDTGTAGAGGNGTAVPGTPDLNGTAVPGAPAGNGTAVPSTPGGNGTAVPSTPGGNGTAVPSTGRDWASLLAAGPATFIDNTGPVPRDLLDRIIGCAGEIYRIIFGPDNEILNHGRAHRLYTAPQRRALIARDRHCVLPDCTVPPERCDSHHGTGRWADGANTDLLDAALVCYHHHRWLHAHNITMTRRNGTWHFYRPDGTEILATPNPWN